MEGKPVDIGLTWKPQNQTEIQSVGVLIWSQLSLLRRPFCFSDTVSSKRAGRRTVMPPILKTVFWNHFHSKDRVYVTYCLPLMMRRRRGRKRIKNNDADDKWVTFTKCPVCARYGSEHFSWTNSFDPHSTLWTQADAIIAPVGQMKKLNWRECKYCSTKVTRLVRGGVRIQTWSMAPEPMLKCALLRLSTVFGREEVLAERIGESFDLEPGDHTFHSWFCHCLPTQP